MKFLNKKTRELYDDSFKAEVKCEGGGNKSEAAGWAVAWGEKVHVRPQGEVRIGVFEWFVVGAGGATLVQGNRHA